MAKSRILIAGIGNIFRGDDGFGVAVAHRLAQCGLPVEVRLVDFGIRGFDLAYALMDDLELAILVDAVTLGGPPGTLYVVEPALDDPAKPSEPCETHGMNPGSVFRMVQATGRKLPPLRLVGCEPATLGSDEDIALGLSEVVQARVDEAARIVEKLVADALA